MIPNRTISYGEKKKMIKLMSSLISFVETLTVKVDFMVYNPFYQKPLMLSSLSLTKCELKKICNPLPLIETLNFLSLTSCEDEVYNLFQNQKKITKIEVVEEKFSWNGFPHDKFDDILKNSDVNAIKFVGAGTGSYFDNEEFPYLIKKLETTMITFHWYVGIRSGRVTFLQSQPLLEDLTISELPNDFDGGEVIKYIFKSMNLKNFYYGKTALILDGVRQQVKKIHFTQIKLTSAFELVRTFPSIESLTLELMPMDMDSFAIERVVNPPTELFNNIREFELIDHTRYNRSFGVFLGVMKNLKNLRKLTLNTSDPNLNTLMEIFVPYMPHIKEININSFVEN